MFFVYVIRSSRDGNLYIGYTDDLRRRINEHNAGENFSTKPREPFKLIYYEAFLEKHDALAREKFFKTGWGRQYLQRVLKNYFLNATR